MFGLKRILGRAIGPSRGMAFGLASLLLVACGQKGPLYLPGPDAPESKKKPAPVQTTPAQTPALPAQR
jgi:predicted small lipoprotein YifL